MKLSTLVFCGFVLLLIVLLFGACELARPTPPADLSPLKPLSMGGDALLEDATATITPTATLGWCDADCDSNFDCYSNYCALAFNCRNNTCPGSNIGAGIMQICSCVTLTPSATPTATATMTVTATSTVTPTATTAPSATPTVTLTPTPTAIATIQVCPTMTVTVNGSLSEWAAVTPVVLNGTPGAYNYVIGTPAANSASFYCAHDADYLYLAGSITDSYVRNSSYDLYQGDAVELAVDGWADGYQAPGWDDHVLVIDTQDRVLDFSSLPISVTVSSGAGAPGWLFEARIAATDLQDSDGTLTTGQQMGTVYSLVNRDDTGSVYDDFRTSHKHSLRMQ